MLLLHQTCPKRLEQTLTPLTNKLHARSLSGAGEHLFPGPMPGSPADCDCTSLMLGRARAWAWACAPHCVMSWMHATRGSSEGLTLRWWKSQAPRKERQHPLTTAEFRVNTQIRKYTDGLPTVNKEKKNLIKQQQQPLCTIPWLAKFHQDD